jgi:hypothetical protein
MMATSMPRSTAPHPELDSSAETQARRSISGIVSSRAGRMVPAGAWTADLGVTQCEQCRAAFGMFLRKHHCRRCGQIFCWECSQRTVELRPAVSGQG